MKIPRSAGSFTSVKLPLICDTFRGATIRHTFRPHGTDDWLLIYTLGGSGHYKYSDGEFHSRPHDVTIYRPGVFQDYQIAAGAKKWELHYAHFLPRPEWLPWLTDPAQNGAGALFDFGCYGADLMTVLMHGQPPISVTAVTQTDKPEIYLRVDDDATVILRYPKAQAVLMPSWNWSFARKDMEVYGNGGYAITVGPDRIRVRYRGEKTEPDAPLIAPPLAAARRDSLSYLAAVLRGQVQPDVDLSSLETNVIVMQILDAALRSAQSGKTITLTPLPQ